MLPKILLHRTSMRIALCFIRKILIKYGLLSLSFFVGHLSIAQHEQPKLIRQVKLANIQQLSVDRYQNIFATSQTGVVYKFDSLGKQVGVFSPNQNNQIDLMETWQALQVFLFYEELQEFILCDRFLGNCLTYSFPEEDLGYISLATLSADGNIWLFDQDNFTLKKFDIRTKQIILETPLNLELENESFDIQYMREYQNQLFILVDGQLYIFDLFANLLRQEAISAVNWLGFLEDDYYYHHSENLHLRALYENKHVQYVLPKAYQQVLMLNPHTVIVLHEQGLDWLLLPQIKD